MSGTIPKREMKLLCIKSGNRCAFSGCNAILVQDSTKLDGESIVAEIAHIKGEKPGSARYDSTMSDKERNSYPNLILLCNNHHQLIDDQPNTYTVEIIKDMKSKHEEWIIDATQKEMMNISFAELEIVTKYLISNQPETTMDYTLIPLKDKINKNGLSKISEKLIGIGMTQVKQVAEYVEKCPDLDFGDRLKEGFVKEYEKLKKKENLNGDELFNALAEFASLGSAEFLKKAAGLAVLVYLFEKCEVFEK